MSLFRKRPEKPVSLRPYTYYKSKNSEPGNSFKTTKSNGSRRYLNFLRIRWSFFRILVVISGFTILIYLLSTTTNPIIRFSTIGANAREASVYRQQIQKIISKSVFNRSKLLFDYRGVEKSIKAEFPEIESVQISFDLVGRRPVVKLISLEPAYIFQTSGLSWVVDSRGIAIGLQTDLKDSFTVALETITDEVGTSAVVGSTLMSTKQIQFLNKVISLLEKQLVVVTEVYVPSTPKELDLKVASDSWRYKMNTAENPAQQAGGLLAVQATLKANSDVPSEYVDLRSNEKVFWK